MLRVIRGSDSRFDDLLHEAKEADPEFSINETNELHQSCLHIAATTWQAQYYQTFN